MYWENCCIGIQHFGKEIKCNLRSFDRASTSLQISFILWGVRIFHFFILQDFIILIFINHIRTGHPLAKASTRQNLTNTWTSGVTTVLLTIALYKVPYCRCSIGQLISDIFIIMGFRTIVFIFIVISTTFRPICPPAFFRCLSNSRTVTELRTTSFIESTGVACSDSVCHNRVQMLSIPVLLLACSQDWTCNLQMTVSLEA